MKLKSAVWGIGVFLWVAGLPGAFAFEGQRYGVKSGVIEYEITGDQPGTQTLYFDEWGKREARYTKATVKMSGQEHKMDTLILLDGDELISADLTSKAAVKLDRNKFGGNLPMPEGENNIVQWSLDMMEKSGAKREGQEVILGRNCDIWSFKEGNSRVWIWNTLTLKAEVQSPNIKMFITAKSFEENAKIPPGKLTLPKGIQVTEMPDLSQIMSELKSKGLAAQ